MARARVRVASVWRHRTMATTRGVGTDGWQSPEAMRAEETGPAAAVPSRAQVRLPSPAELYQLLVDTLLAAHRQGVFDIALFLMLLFGAWRTLQLMVAYLEQMFDMSVPTAAGVGASGSCSRPGKRAASPSPTPARRRA